MEYEVILLRSGHDHVIYWGKDREKAIHAMQVYVAKNGFFVQELTGRYVVTDIILLETERISAANEKVSVTRYCELFDLNNRRL